MKSLLASVRTLSGLDRVDHAVQLLEDEWRQHGEVQLERLWTEQKRVLAIDADDSVVLLAELIKTDLQCRYARGQSPTVAEYLERFPELEAAETRVLSLIYEEFCLIEERGDAINVDLFCARYPHWKDSLASQLQYHRLFSQAAGQRPKPPPFPEAGDTFEEFQLISLLGKGGTSRVFLARDLSLGGKQVVLKVSLDRGQEPKAQGALDHPHIVPVNSVVFDDHHLRGLSMPYRPGLPLDEVIKRLGPGARPRDALALWRALVEGTKASPTAPAEGGAEGAAWIADGLGEQPRGDGWDAFPVRGSFSQGVAWIVMTLARALSYAHGMRTYHRDVKPGNVLLTLHQGPQLLDFNLAESPHTASQAEAAMYGGTLPYMAPEQIEAFLNPELWEKVGAKADIYSLGLVLRELLTGHAPDLPAQTLSPRRALRVMLDRRPLLDVSVRRANPAIPHALEAIVVKCLTISPDDRYPDAAALAEDLERFLRRRPLVHASNPSQLERLGNRVVRHRRGLAAAVASPLLLALLVALCFVLNAAALARPKPAPPSIGRSPLFLGVVQNVESEQFDRAIEPLKQLNEIYRQSWQPKIYLCLALTAKNDLNGTESLVREAFKAPDARTEVLAWGKDHPGFARHFGSFALALVARAMALAEKNHARTPSSMQAFYGPVREPLLIANSFTPNSPLILRDLALTDEVFDDRETACLRLTNAIELHRTCIKRKDGGPEKDESEELNYCYLLRCRIGLYLADHLRTSESPRAGEEALQRLRQATRDIDHCGFYLSTHKRGFKLISFTLGMKANAFLSLGETEIDLGHLLEARQHLLITDSTISDYLERLLAQGDRDHAFVASWRERSIAAFERLRAKEAAGAVGGAWLVPFVEPPSKAGPNDRVPSA